MEAFWSPDAPHSGWDIGHFGERFGDAILRFDPSVRIVASSVAREYVVVFRKGHAIAEETIGPLEAAALERALAGERVSKVCEAFLGADEPDVTATATLGKWLRSGWVRALE
ncbi:MAG TPA: hypothetical protein VH054_18735 [Polyangiaceae bacterium]|nr:hypothetical protein [Polyangiaceae bacterium]